MADLCDLVEDAAAATGDSPSNVILPVAPLADVGVLSDLAISVMTALFTDSATAGDAITDSRGFTLTSAGTVTGTVVSQTAETASFITDSATARGAIYTLAVDLVEVSGTLADVVMQGQIADLLRDAGVLGEQVAGTLDATDLVVQAMRGDGMLLRVVYEQLLEASGVAAGVSIGFMDATDLAAIAGVLGASVSDQAAIAELVVVAGELAVVLTDQLDALELVREEGFATDAVLGGANGMTWWTAATDTLGMSRYRMPAFDSMAPMNGKLVMVGAAGAFVRDGTDDAGTPIDAYVRTGLEDFGSAFLKRLNHFYAGYVSGGSLAVEVGETSTGVEVVYSYTMPPRAAVAPTHGRVLLGRGLRSLYYRFTLRNTEGQPLGITAARVEVDDTKRKV